LLNVAFNLITNGLHSLLYLALSFAPGAYAVCLSIIVVRITLSYGKRTGTAILLIIFLTSVIFWPIYLFLIPIFGLTMFPGIKKNIRTRSETYRHARWNGIEDYVNDYEDIEEDILLTRGIEYCKEHTDEQVQRTLF